MMNTAAFSVKERQRTLLVVDDNPVIRRLVREQFLSDGFKACTEAASGREAIAAARKAKFHIVILDVAMPEMNGLEAAPLLKEILPDTLIILFTLHAEQLKNQDLASLGVSAAFSKSDPLEELVTTAHTLIGW
jgi:CheY-like chemotaxis protein